MALEFKLSQKLSQTLIMTPQLQQAIKLLHLGRLDYLQVISEELESNPVLENIEEPAAEKSLDDEVFQIPSEAYSYSNSTGSGSGDLVEALAGQQEGLGSHLLWQLRMSDLRDQRFEIASYLIGNLDRNGYLSTSTAEVAIVFGVDEREVEAVLNVVQSFDPIGIAARDLRECLLLQLESQGLVDTLVWRIVANHLPRVEHGLLAEIAKHEACSEQDVVDAVREIRKLEPRPARPYFDEVSIYVVPDVYVRKVGDEYVVTLNENGIPRLRLNPEYERLVDSSGYSASERDYLRERCKAAAWLIKSVEQRQQTILRVTESIMRFQNDFLEKGVSGLKPLILKDVAEDVELHQSTVSRVTTNKYVHTPQGVFELKYFFSSKLRNENGEDVSSETVRKRIKELIAGELPATPLSDQALTEILAKEGVEIARRTVAKYRESLGILSSSRRKKQF